MKKLLSTQISLNRRDPSGCGGNKAPRGNHPPTPSQGVSRNPFNDAWNMNEGVLGIIQIFLQLAKSCNGEKYWQPNRSDNLSTPLFWETRLGTGFLRDIGNSSNLAPCPSYQLEEALLLVIYHYNFSFCYHNVCANPWFRRAIFP